MLIRISRSRDKKKNSRRDNKFILPTNKQRHPLSSIRERKEAEAELKQTVHLPREEEGNMADNKSHTEISDATH